MVQEHEEITDLTHSVSKVVKQDKSKHITKIQKNSKANILAVDDSTFNLEAL